MSCDRPWSTKIADENYHKALKDVKYLSKKEKEVWKREEKALSTVLGGSPSKPKSSAIQSEDEDGDIDDFELPWETLYMIDKIVWQWVKKGPFGA